MSLRSSWFEALFVSAGDQANLSSTIRAIPWTSKSGALQRWSASAGGLSLFARGAGDLLLLEPDGRQGFSWSWIKGRTRDETDLPRRFSSVPKLYIRGITVSMPGNNPTSRLCLC
jgi:hypothetical protein